uniref:Pheromone binding protein 2 n=1 Tax=Atrijuglans hetaohei TaxID=1511833 RepID=A0A0D5YA72_9NEOP|nr:pheromone binding protein 2 [Atrijuglans hetaohei]
MAASSKWRVMMVAVLLSTMTQVLGSQEIMKKLTLGFSKALDQCKKEMNIQDHIMQDFYNFWREEYSLVNREMGCAMLCLASKLDLVTDDNKLHHTNAREFAKSHGADDDLAKQLIDMIHECEKVHEGIQDDCVKVLEIAKCFRTKIHDLKWAPSMETVLEEVMTEIQ